MAQSEEIRTIAQVAERLRDRFPGVPAETVDELVASCHQEFEGHPIRDFIAVPVERQVADHIRAIPSQRRA